MSPTNNTMSVAALRALLDANVHVLGDMDADGSLVLIQNGRAHYGTEATPMFSSADVLQASVDSSQTYLTMSTRDLFVMLPGATFVLDPRSSNRQEFSAELVKQLLDGSYFQPAPSVPAPLAHQSFADKMRSAFKRRF